MTRRDDLLDESLTAVTLDWDDAKPSHQTAEWPANQGVLADNSAVDTEVASNREKDDEVPIGRMRRRDHNVSVDGGPVAAETPPEARYQLFRKPSHTLHSCRICALRQGARGQLVMTATLGPALRRWS